MSVFKMTNAQPKVHFSEYIRTQNEDKSDAQPSNPTEPAEPTPPKAEQ